jgi:autotransporter-associated beta strand protein
MLLLLFSTASNTFADSATWKISPATGDWNHAANWTPPTIPNGPAETATFQSSNVTDISLSADTEVNGVVFNAGASAFTINSISGQFLIISGVGITNNSGIPQNFVAVTKGVFNFGAIVFTNSATAGSGTFFTNTPRSVTHFSGTSTAGNGNFINNGAAIGGPGGSSAGETLFVGTSSAANGTFTNNGATLSGGYGGMTVFGEGSTAGNATLIANRGSGGGPNAGGAILFFDNPSGGTARVEVFGNGNLDISPHDSPGITVGSVEGDGRVFLGGDILTVGSNNLSTNFSGVIQDGGSHGGTGGSVTKIGTGKLVLSHRNTYTGGTTVKRGRLVVNNAIDSGTGSGPVQVNGGRLAGKGTIAGAVTVGSGLGREAVLSPGYHHSLNPGTLTIQSPLIFNSDATYEIEVNSSSETVDKVVALGVTINVGAQTLFADLGNGTFTVGNVFTVIDNTSATPIAGTFSNLPDGSTFTSNGNSYEVNYEGGDGNDLTLTIVP